MTNFMSSPLLRGSQDLGSQFTFEEDTGALRSILNNEGLTHAQVQRAAPVTGLTPAKALPNSVKKVSNQLEFFETKGGQVFFRRKVLADSAVKPSTQTSGKKSKFGNNLGRGENPWLPRRMPISIKKMGATPAGRGKRTPLALRTNDRMLPPKNPGTERRPAVMAPPVYRQSISERKAPVTTRGPPSAPSAPASVIAAPENPARKSLYNKFGLKNAPEEKPKRKPIRPGDELKHKELFQPSLTKLTRESMRCLPRESLAWLTELPRESATFAELQKMMTDSDKNLMDDDDTDSFEALESRLRTPYKKKPSPLVEDNKENNMNESGIEPINETVAEIVEEEAQEVPRTPLVKSVSSSDVSSTQVPDVPVVIARSGSLSNISSVEEMSDLVNTEHVTNILESLEQYQEQLEIFRTEQDKLAEMEADLMRRIRERKAEFKTVWGVSPININTRRTVIAKKHLGSELTKQEEGEERTVQAETERRVRFNSGSNMTRAVTPGQDTPVTSHTKQRKKSRKSFDSLKCSLNFLKTPQTAARRERRTEATAGQPEVRGQPTPQALRLLSDRVMAEFTDLYSDSPDDSSNLSDLLQSKVKLDFS